jgi:hypothetical protein
VTCLKIVGFGKAIVSRFSRYTGEEIEIVVEPDTHGFEPQIPTKRSR